MTPNDVFVFISTGIAFVTVGTFMAGVAPVVTNAFKVGILFAVVGAGLISVGMSIDEKIQAAAEPKIAAWASGPDARPALQWPPEFDSWDPTLKQHCINCHENKSPKPVDPNSDL